MIASHGFFLFWYLLQRVSQLINYFEGCGKMFAERHVHHFRWMGFGVCVCVDVEGSTNLFDIDSVMFMYHVGHSCIYAQLLLRGNMHFYRDVIWITFVFTNGCAVHSVGVNLFGLYGLFAGFTSIYIYTYIN